MTAWGSGGEGCRLIIASDKRRNTFPERMRHLSAPTHSRHICERTHGSVPHRGRWGWRACSPWVRHGSPHAASRKGSRCHVPARHTNALSHMCRLTLATPVYVRASTPARGGCTPERMFRWRSSMCLKYSTIRDPSLNLISIEVHSNTPVIDG